MGCSCSAKEGNELLFIETDPVCEKLEVASIDEVITGAETVLTDLEAFRKQIAHPYGKLLIASGAVSLKNHGFIHALKGFLFQIARECESDISANIKTLITIKYEEPYIDINTEFAVKVGDKVKNTFDALKEFFSALVKTKDNFEALEKSIMELKDKVVDNFDKFQDDLSSLDCTAAATKGKSLLNFKNKLMKGVDIVIAIGKIFKDLFTESKKFIDNIEKEKELFKKLFTEKKKEGNDDNAKLLWNYSSNEDRFSNFNEHKRLLEIINGVKAEPITKKENKPAEKKEAPKEEPKGEEERKEE